MMSEIKTHVDEPSLELLRNGDKAEFAKLVDMYSGKIYRLVLRILGNQRDAEDVLQETFLNAYRSIARFEGRSSISTWLYRIATNEALMAIRKQKPQVSLDVEGENDRGDAINKPYHFADWCCLPENDLQSAEVKSQMRDAIQRLSPALQTVFILRDIEGFSVKKTAEILETNEGVVKTRLLRARLRLREDLSEYFGKNLGEVS
ncbi:MAG: sigma-70 family RNA polymerase sigma factor [Anaerolineaceae bacterium]|nr:sigma-70 family RNA polymerase sigma factor [Anaerolineaceae bacterium]